MGGTRKNISFFFLINVHKKQESNSIFLSDLFVLSHANKQKNRKSPWPTAGGSKEYLDLRAWKGRILIISVITPVLDLGSRAKGEEGYFAGKTFLDESS